LQSSPTTTTYNPSRSSTANMVGFLSRQLSSSSATNGGGRNGVKTVNGLFSVEQQQRRGISDRSGKNAAAAFYEPPA
jgi:ribosomal protein L34